MANNKNLNKEKGQAPKGKKASNKTKKPQSKFKSILKKTFLGLVVLGIICTVIGLGYVFAIIKSTPPLDVQSVLTLNEPSKLYDSNGEYFENFTTEEIRHKVESEEIPQHLKDAYVAIEDERFYEHKGVDIRRILGALVADVKYFITGSGGIQGASTMTQQLIKNTLLTNEVKIERKVREIYLSLELEKQLSKDEILTAYLNTIPLSGQIYGVEAASEYFFDKKAIDLTIAESAYLAGLTQAPTSYSAFNPANNENPKYVPRTITVLNKMLELGKITQEQYDEAYDVASNNKFVFKSAEIDYTLNYESFVYPVRDQVTKDLKEEYKYTDDEIKKLISNGGLKIYTTMDRALQDSTQEILDNRKNLAVDGSKENLDENGMPLLQASAVIMDNRTGEVKALIGGRGPQPPTFKNRAYSAMRSIGSSTKPLTAYGPALDTKTMTAGTPIDDAPLPSSVGNQYGSNYSPNNHDFKMEGYIGMRKALVDSKNIATILTVHNTGVNTAVNYGEKLGLVYGPKSQNPSALGLGQFTNDPENPDGGNTYTLTGAYATLANKGAYREPKLYTKVVDATGKTILEPESEETKVFSPETAFILTDILKGTSTNLGSTIAPGKNIPVAGKTGTTEYSQDLWYAGYSPYYTGSVWIGYDKPQKISGYSSAPQNLWGKIMVKAHEGLDSANFFEKPSGVVSTSYCIDSGKKPSELCEHDQRGSRVRTEYFIKGTEPTDVCDVHVKATVNSATNKLANENTPASLRVDRVFIKKPNASSSASDYNYVLPTSYDDSSAIPAPPVEDDDDKDEENDTPTPPGNPDGTPGTGGGNGGGTGNGGNNGTPGTGGNPIIPPATLRSMFYKFKYVS